MFTALESALDGLCTRLPPLMDFLKHLEAYIGPAREKCSVGDEIWILGGCCVPVLLSPEAESQSNHEVRGETFLDGFMFGEIMNTDCAEHLHSGKSH